MTTDHTGTLLRSSCFYVAGYLGLGSLGLVAYRSFLSYCLGIRVSDQMWTVLSWTGLQHPPSLHWTGAQPLIDQAWGLIGNCSIAVMLGSLALAAAFLGLLRLGRSDAR
jgi:hypothetical protein